MRFRLLAAATLALSFASAHAQGSDPETAALDHGALTIWIVHPAPAIPQGKRPANGTARPVAPMVASAVTTKPLTNEIHEQTAGSFGTPSSEVGTTAGDFGQPASTLGANASEHGKPASEHGQTAASFGTAASNVGQTAGSYGQTAGSFGESLSTIATAGQPKTAAPAIPHDTQLMVWAMRESANLHATLRDVRMEDLAEELTKAAHTHNAPDVLIGAPLLTSDWSNNLARRHGVVALASTTWWAFRSHTDFGASMNSSLPGMAILLNAPHPAEARIFVTQALEGCMPSTRIVQGGLEDCHGDAVPPPSPLTETAQRAYVAMLSGGGFEPADPIAATFDTAITAATLLPHPDWYSSDDLHIRTVVTGVSERKGIALVGMLGILDSRTGFGIVHGYAVLRTDPEDAGHWRVLSLSPNMNPVHISAIFRDFNDLVPQKPNPALTLLPVSLAAPSDADNRGPTPDLWWDAHPGAEMEVVEYQPGQDGDWQAPRLMWVPDHNENERTRVTAAFARSGSFRWRVWSIGPAGQTVFSAWRTFNIVR